MLSRRPSWVYTLATLIVSLPFLISLATPSHAAPISQQQYIDAGGSASMAAYGNMISQSESSQRGFSDASPGGKYLGFWQANAWNQQHYSGVSGSAFQNDPSAQVRGFENFEKYNSDMATKYGFYSHDGEQACGIKMYAGQCATITDSSIIYASQFGTGPNSKLGYYLSHGNQCIPGKSTPTNDGNGVCAADYLVKGANMDVSAVTGRPNDSNGANKTTAKPSNPKTPDPAKTDQTKPADGQQQPPPSKTPSNPNFNGSVDQPMNPSITFTPQQLGANGSMMAIGDPTVCWVCDAVIHSMGVSEALVKNGATTLLNELWPLVMSLFLLSFLYAILRAIVQGSNPVLVAIPMLARFAVVAALAGGTTLATSGTTSTPSTTSVTMGQVAALSLGDTGGGDQGNSVSITPADGATGNGSLSSSTYATDLFLEPPVDLGATMGTDLGAAASSAIGITLNPGNCKHDDIGSSGISILATSATALVNLACEVHAFASTGINLGGVIVTHPVRDSAYSDQMLAWVVAAVGLLVMFMSFQALLGFGFALVECVIVSGVVAVFLPIMIMSYAFESTRGMLRHAWDNMLFVMVYLTMSGIGGVVMVFVLVKGMALGLGQPTLSDPQAIVTAFDGLFSGSDVTTATSFPAVLKFVCFTSAGSLLAGRLMQGVHHVAAEVTNHALAQQAGLARAGMAMVQRTAAMGLSFAGAGGAIGLHAAGSLAGKLVGGVGQSAVKGVVRQTGARLARPPGR